MARPPRIHFDGAMYHVFSRGVGRMTIFREDDDYRYFLKLTKEAKKEIPFEMFTYCLMPNHFHFLVKVLNAATGVFMHQIMMRYANFFKWKYGWTGHVFQGRHRAILCETDPYLKTLLRYIPLNPVRAGIVPDPSEWLWSGHQEYLGKPGWGLIDSSIPLGMFSEDETHARERYLQFVYDGIKMKHRSDLYPRSQRPILGSPLFIHHIEKFGRLPMSCDSIQAP